MTKTPQVSPKSASEQYLINNIVAQKDLSKQLTEVSKHNPCPHCGKAEWCYRIGELTVCNRDSEPATGWSRTNKTDSNGKYYYAPEPPKKEPRPQQKKEYIYCTRDGKPLVKVTRIDDGLGKKRIFQSHWDGMNWVKGLTPQIKKQIPIYRYADIRKAISEGKAIFMVEGEEVADVLWNKGIAATTTLGGAQKYRTYGIYKDDLAEAKIIVL
ncbi:MAG: hypothetical protein AAF349_10915, partial [Cyanobacteria bacterium P01_A01_bin.68]